jgi:UDP-N-acetylmuramoylalanine--D-glutamate ligase
MHKVEQFLRQKLQNQKVLVLGLGRQGGVKVANRLAELGAKVRVSDQQTPDALATEIAQLNPGIETKLGSHDTSDILWADMIVKNPAVPFDHPMVKFAEEQNIPVTTETALALRSVRERTIGVTGTRGKTTTSHAIWHLLKEAGRDVVIGGNIPQQPTIETVLNASDAAIIVLELSSFQLESLDREQLSPHIAVLTSLSPDHLNRYGTMENYAAVKAHIFRWQQPGDKAFWIEQPEWESLLTAAVPTDVKRKVLTPAEITSLSHRFPGSLSGEHNQANLALATAVGQSLEVNEETLQRATTSFTGVPYRQQIIPTTDGLTWINDTTATTPTALLTALKTYADRDLILITGGTTKKLPFPPELLRTLSALQDRIIWLTGSGTAELTTALAISPPATFEAMNQAVAAARELAERHGVTTVLLSPGFSSFEHFQNEFDRGDQFNASLQNTAHTP